MNKNYIFMYCAYSIIVFCIAILFEKARIKKSKIRTLLFLLIAIGSLIAAFRPEKTQDTEIYNVVYQNSVNYLNNFKINNLISIFANRSFYNIELFYVFIMAGFRHFFDSPVFFYFVQAFISNVVMVQAIYLLCEYIYELDTKEKKDIFTSHKLILIYSFYQIFCGVLYTSSAIRDGLSISLGVFAIASLLTGKRKKIAILFLLMSILIHTTSVILLVIYFVLWIWKSKISSTYLWMLSVLIPVFYFLKIGTISVELFTRAAEKILQLFHIPFFYSYITQLDYQLPMREAYIVVLSCFIIVMISNKHLKNDKYIVIAFMGLIMFTLAYPIPSLARLLYIFIIFLIPVVIGSYRLSKIVYLMWTLYFIPQYIYVFGYL